MAKQGRYKIVSTNGGVTYRVKDTYLVGEQSMPMTWADAEALRKSLQAAERQVRRAKAKS